MFGLVMIARRYSRRFYSRPLESQHNVVVTTSSSTCPGLVVTRNSVNSTKRSLVHMYAVTKWWYDPQYNPLYRGRPNRIALYLFPLSTNARTPDSSAKPSSHPLDENDVVDEPRERVSAIFPRVRINTQAGLLYSIYSVLVHNREGE